MRKQRYRNGTFSVYEKVLGDSEFQTLLMQRVFIGVILEPLRCDSIIQGGEKKS